uniref:Uncharacterized protein n=1 Tax=Loa loa TaxID=7209 RepID=A0A1I7VEC6_LOALO
MPNIKGKKPTISLSIKDEFDEERIRQMEEMARNLESSTAISPAAHFGAIWYFRNISTCMTLDQCRIVIGKTSNEILTCSMAENASTLILRGWKNLEPIIKKENFDYFLGQALLKHR